MTDEKLREIKEQLFKAKEREFDLSCRIRPRDSGYDEDIDESIPPYPEGHNPVDDFLIATYDAARSEGKAEGETAGQKNAVLRIREHSTYRSNLPEAGYYEVDAELLDEFDDDPSVLAPTKEGEK